MVAATDASVRSIMDALAALVDARWKYAQRKTYILLVGERELDQVFMPNSEWEKDRFRAGRPFLDALGGLSASQSAEIESGSKMQFTDLPANLHQPISDMLTSLSREYRDKGAGDTVSPTNLSRCTVRVQRKPASGFNRLFITVTDPGVVTSGWRLNDYEAQKVARESAEQAKSGVALDIYAARSARMSQAEAKLITRLKQKVTIELPDATFVRVLKHIHEAHGISFVCDAEQYMPQRANVRIVNMALSDALDKLVDLYKGTEWEWRKMGVLVVRGPANPVRQKPEDKLKPHQ